jgi:hypothetical protein
MHAPWLLLLVVSAGVLGGCASGPKSSSRIYEGDAPSVRMTERQRVGGPADPGNYR